jgi:hypothetical protein
VIKRWLIRNVIISDATNQFLTTQTALDLKAPLNSTTAFTGTVLSCNFCDGRFRKYR